MAAFAVATIYLTMRVSYPEDAARRRLHWLGIAISLLPVVWFCVWWLIGVVSPGVWFLHGLVQIRE
jgi:hypothetical protein